MFASGDVDVVAAFDVASGEELWRYELGEMYVGHNGSHDGPNGTPTIAGDAVFALGPHGRMVALGLGDGAVAWQRELTEDGTEEPFHGYTTSPIVAGDRVIVLTGGEGQSITAFDRATGEPVWAAGDDSVNYQTPTLVESDGHSLLIAPTDQFLQALDPESGEIAWQLQYAEGEQRERQAHVVPVSGGRFLLWLQRGSKLYRFDAEGAEELWATNAFGNSLGVPVHLGDHFYGYTGRFLSCVDLETGEILWRSRPPAGQGVAAVGGALASLGREGDLVLIDASPEGYRELTRLAVFEQGDYATPSFVDGHFLVRNMERMAAVRVDTASAPRLAEKDDSDRIRGAFGSWVEEVQAMAEGERQMAVESRFAELEATPIREGDLAHFVWRGEAEDVGVSGDFLAAGDELGLYRLAGTDLFFRSVELDAKAQYTYAFSSNYSQPGPDPDNPYSVDMGFAVFSELRMPEWPESPHLEAPAEDAPRGTLDSFQFRSEILDNTRELRVWRPQDYGASDARYPVLIVNHGDNQLRGGLMQNTLDNLVGQSVAPLIAVFVPRAEQPEYGGEKADDYTRFLVEELLPHIDRHYRTDGETRAIMGPGSAGVAALYASFQHPEVFQQVASQSYYTIAPADEKLPEMIRAEGDKPSKVYVVWSNHDYDLGPGLQAAEATRDLLGHLNSSDINVVELVADYSPQWGGWRGQHDEILAALFPAEEPDE
jgi:enterochelin esterase-like enzyme/outer membrane protein assembly factor BamB